MLDDGDRQTLRALCDALIPETAVPVKFDALAKTRGSDVHAADSMEQALELLPEEQVLQVVRLLRIIDSPLTALLWLGTTTRFSKLNSVEAGRLLTRLSTSRFDVVRRGFEILKRFVAVRAYGNVDAQEKIWRQIGYDRIDRQRGGERRLSTPQCPDRCETLVIGSGAGGAVAAARLAAMGQSVVVLEKGPEMPQSVMDGIETEAMDRMFEQGGLMTTTDGAISLFAGSCLGGGTTVNWSASFRLPDAVRHEWRVDHGVDWLGTDVMEQAYRFVEDRTGVRLHRVPDNPQNTALRHGCEQLGIPVRQVPRNTPDCTGDRAQSCGRCGLGCAYGRKMGMTQTFLPDVVEHGGTVFSGATVRRILTEGDRAVGAEVLIEGPAGRSTHRLWADRVVLAAGALHTPAILLRSGVSHPWIGRNLHLHPTVGVAGYYPHPIRGWEGPVMSAYTEAFAEVDGAYGVRLETPPIYPGLVASALPWNGAATYKEDLALIAHMAAFIVLTRDRSSGTVSLAKDGTPAVRYRVGDADLAMLLSGMIEAARIHVAAGAEKVLFPFSTRKMLSAQTGERLADLGREIFTWGWRPGLYALFSAHQMGTCRMGGDAKTHPVDPEGRFRGVRGLYVSDASLFPTASGVNPSLTIQAVAHSIAGQVR